MYLHDLPGWDQLLVPTTLSPKHGVYREREREKEREKKKERKQANKKERKNERKKM